MINFKEGDYVKVKKSGKTGRVFGINGIGFIMVEFPANSGCASVILTYTPAELENLS